MSDTNFNVTTLFILGFDTDTTCHKSTKPKIHQWSEMYFQTTGGNALLTCRSAGPHEIFWIGPNGKPVDIKGKKYQVRDLVAMSHFNKYCKLGIIWYCLTHLYIYRWHPKVIWLWETYHSKIWAISNAWSKTFMAATWSKHLFIR